MLEVSQKTQNHLEISHGTTNPFQAYLELAIFLLLFFGSMFYFLAGPILFPGKIQKTVTPLFSYPLLFFVLMFLEYMRICCCLAHGRKIAINKHDRTLIVKTFSLARGKTVTDKYPLSETPDIVLKEEIKTLISPHGPHFMRNWNVEVCCNAPESLRIAFPKEMDAIRCAESIAKFLTIPLKDLRSGDQYLHLFQREPVEDLSYSYSTLKSPRFKYDKNRKQAVFSLSPVGFTPLVMGSFIPLALLSIGFIGSYIQEGYIDRVLIYELPIPLFFLLFILYGLFSYEKIKINDKNLESVMTCAGLRLFSEKMPLSHINTVRCEIDQARRIYDEVLSIESSERIIKIRAKLPYDEMVWLWRAVQNSVLTYRNPRRAQS
jgi:hypothetical protein